MHHHSNNVKRKLILALAIASGITVLELTGGIVGNSIALLSDAGHLFGDVMAISLSLFALGIAAKQHTRRLTYGYHRAEVLAALANGIILAAITGFVTREAYERLYQPPVLDASIVITVASIGLASNVFVAFLLREAQKGSLNVRGAYLHVFYDAISSIGVIAGATVAALTGYYAIDPIIAFIIAGLIAKSAAGILRESIHILLEGTPKSIDLRKIVIEIKNIEGVLDIHDLHAWTISSGIHALSGHVIVQDQMVSKSSKIVEDIDMMLRSKFQISHTTIQIESEKTVKDIRRRLD